jgi:ATP-binding cassette, subfamily G (WHITE), eye pigment precursor transporter
VPSYFIWLRYISWFNYANELLLINQWSNIDNIPCNNNQSVCFYNGDNIITALDMNKLNFWRNLGLMLVVIVSYRTLAYIALVIKSNRR